MASGEGDRKRLEPDTWRRIGAVLDRVSGVDPRAHPEAIAEACRAEGLRVEDVHPFLAAERGSDRFLERLDVAVVDGALRDAAGETRLNRVAAGDRLGPYEIVAPVAAGGMGEVYEARDTRLGRTVAIKLLTRDLAADPEGRQRFDREARAISALNHPHVCTLYDVSHEAGVDFLVMELVQGETLAARLQRGPLSIDETLKYGAQIADALAAAHGKGVVHRDLKPANVMLTSRGVKLLDFGLAALRARDAVPGVGEADVTAEGTVLGTPAYMAPEQVHGKSVDARADIFALGAVMHEMLTGRRPFEAGSTAGVIAAVLERDVDRISKYRSDAPDALEWTIRTCLAKDPDDRWQSAADVARQLQWISASGTTPSSGIKRWPRRKAIGWIAASILVAVVVTAALTRAMWRPPSPTSPPQIARFALHPPDGHFYDRMHALSPDGHRIAFVTTDPKELRALWVRAIDALTPQRLPGTDGASYPFWSPDGRFIGFFADNALKKVELATGSVEITCKCETGTGGGGTWNSDGVILFSKGLVVSPLWRVPASGGTPIAITPVSKKSEELIDLTGTNSWPQFLPDGKHFLWLTGAQGTPGLFAGRLDSDERKRVLEFSPGLRSTGERTRGWYAGGYLFFVRQQALMAQRFSLDRLELVGDPIRVVGEVEQTAPGRSSFDVSPGVLAYRERRDERTVVRLVWFDRTGREVGTLGDPASYIGLALSRDGRHVLASSASSGLVRIDTARGIPTPVGLAGQSPVWAPDGMRFGLSGGGRAAPIPSIASLANAEDVKTVASRLIGGQAWPTDWSSDGRYIVGHVLNAETLFDIWALDVQASPMTMRYLIRAPGYQQDQRISPDGRWVAYASNERSERYEVYVRPFPVGSETWRVSTAGGRLPAWTAAGRELLYVSPDGTLMRAAVAPGGEFSAGAPQPLFRHDALQRGYNRDAIFGRFYDVTDGGRILLTIPVSDPPPKPIVVILNWEQLLGGPTAR